MKKIWSIMKKIFFALVVIAFVAAINLSFLDHKIGDAIFFAAILIFVLVWTALQYRGRAISLFIYDHRKILERILALTLVIIVVFCIFSGITSLIDGGIFISVVCLLSAAALVLLLKNDFLRIIKDLKKKAKVQ